MLCIYFLNFSILCASQALTENYKYLHITENRDNSIRIENELRTGQPGFDSRQGQEFSSSPPCPNGLWSPPNLLSNAYRCLSSYG